MKRANLFLIIIAVNLILITLFTKITLAADTCDGLCNPIGSNTMTLNELYIRMAQLMLGATGLFGVLMFIYGGLILLTSAGNPEKVKKAKDTLVWAVGGIVVILLSASVVNYIFKNFSF